jgi:hypothetical protein
MLIQWFLKNGNKITFFYFLTKKLQKGILEERSLFEALGI